jgi:hypothetical protein
MVLLVFGIGRLAVRSLETDMRRYVQQSLETDTEFKP